MTQDGTVQQDDTQTPVEAESTENWHTQEQEPMVEESSVESVEEETVENPQPNEEGWLKEKLARLQADFDNYKKRVERDKVDMMMFMRSDIIWNILPRVDDLERILSNTPEEQKTWTMYEGIVSIHAALLKDLEKMWVTSFTSKGSTINPDFHEVMTQASGQEGVILDEFTKGYMIQWRVLRHAKVVVGNGQ